MIRHTSGQEGASEQSEGQRTPPIDVPLDPGTGGHQPVNNSISQPNSEAPKTTRSGKGRRLHPTKISPDIIP
jgi:hypothetical protein